MKAISLWQPWASAVALGSKLIETRSWPTRHRGPIAIHGAKRKNLAELIHYNSCWSWRGALRIPMAGPCFHEILPFGAIIAVAELVDCKSTDSFTLGELDEVRYPLYDTEQLYGWTERQLGDFSLGRFGWVLSNVQPLREPIPFIGHQGLFNIPDELVNAAKFVVAA